MKYPFVPLAAILTILALILGSWAQGLAQTKPRARELVAMVICAEGGSTPILLDARGQPVAPEDCAHGLCPDCVPVLAQSVASPQTTTVPLVLTAFVPSAPILCVPVEHAHAVPFARGPPDLA